MKGGAFLIEDATDIFIPENWSEEQRLIARTCQDFLNQYVFPNLDRIDAQEEGLMPHLLDKAAELGLLAISVPEEYGGIGESFLTSMLSTEVLGAGHSFAVAISAHTGIGTLPILYYGNEEQKRKYLPRLASGEWKGAYCLTEPGSGSDADSGRTRARLDADGKHYILNGQKMWITNAGFADVFTVFSKIDDDEHLSAFIVEKGFEGVSLNAEEHKMGIKGSSTRQVFFTDCKVPVENMLSTRQNGFKIAVNILNLGRIKLGGAAIGASKRVIGQSVRYAHEREQFGRPIEKYGAIQSKLANMAAQTYVTESATYRASNDIDRAIAQLTESGMDASAAKLKAAEQYAIEAAIIKVHASESLDYTVDEGVQIYGGMGYSAEAPMERSYRDARINRIFEGTNEINRMLTVDMMLKRALKGELALMPAALKVAGELMAIPDFGAEEAGVFVRQHKILSNLKKLALMTAGVAVQKLAATLAKEQEVLMGLADMLIQIYVSESVLLRVEKLASQRGAEAIEGQIAIMQLQLQQAAETLAPVAREIIAHVAEGDEQRMLLLGVKRFTKHAQLDLIALRKTIVRKLIESQDYCF